MCLMMHFVYYQIAANVKVFGFHDLLNFGCEHSWRFSWNDLFRDLVPKVVGFLKVSNVKIYSTIVNQGIMISIGPCSYQNIDSYCWAIYQLCQYCLPIWIIPSYCGTSCSISLPDIYTQYQRAAGDNDFSFCRRSLSSTVWTLHSPGTFSEQGTDILYCIIIVLYNCRYCSCRSEEFQHLTRQ